MSELPPNDAPKPASTPEPQQHSRFQRASFWLLKWGGRLLITLILTTLVAREGCRHAGQRALRAEEARLDAAEPGWRLADLVAARDRTAPPDAQNSAHHVRKVRAAITPEWALWVKSEQMKLGDPTALNRKQHLSNLIGDDPDAFDAVRPARELALALRDVPNGFHPVPVDANLFDLKLDETQGAREVVTLMQADALHAAQAGDPRRALRAAHAALNTGRSIGDEPTLISMLVRIAAAHLSAESAMRTLALADGAGAEAELAALQAALLKEMDEPLLLIGLRGERAMMQAYFERIDRVAGADEMSRMLHEQPSSAARGVWYLRLAFFPEDRKRHLELISFMIDAARGPTTELLAAGRTFEDRVRAGWDVRYPFHRLMLPAVDRVAQASLRHRADCGSAAVLLACERFRLKHGKFPNALAELPKDLLAAVPLDPYTGAPLKFARTPDGIAVYAQPPKGALPTVREGEVRLTAPLGGDEFGWRLFDAKHRGLPPLPKPKPEPEPELP